MPTSEEIRDEILNEVYVSPTAARRDVARAQEQFNRYVQNETHGQLVGEIRDVEGFGGGRVTFTTGDMRETWILTVLKPNGDIVSQRSFLPLADPDSLYSYADDLAQDVKEGTFSKEKAQKSLQYHADVEMSEELESFLDSVGFSELFPEAANLKAQGASYLSPEKYLVPVRQHTRGRTSITFHTRRKPSKYTRRR